MLRCVNGPGTHSGCTAFLSALPFHSPSWLKTPTRKASLDFKADWWGWQRDSALRVNGKEDSRSCHWKGNLVTGCGQVVIHKDEIWSARHQQVYYEWWGQFIEMLRMPWERRRLWVNRWVNFGRIFFLIRKTKRVLSKNQKAKVIQQCWYFQAMPSVKTHRSGTLWGKGLNLVVR